MITPDDLTLSEKKTRKVLYGIIGRKISESRKSSRRKLEGISNKLNINVDILKKIESGDIEEIEKEIPITGFIRAFAKFTKTDISEEIEKLQSDYVIQEKPKSIYTQVPSIKTSKILVVFLLSFGFLLVILYVLSLSEKKNDNILSKNHSSQRHEDFVSEDFVKNYKRKEEDKGKLDQSRIKLEKR